MDIKELKQLIKNNTSVLVLDNGEPSFVILDYSSFKDMSKKEQVHIPERHVNHQPKQSPDSQEVELLERLNKEILAIKNQIEEEEKRQELEQEE